MSATTAAPTSGQEDDDGEDGDARCHRSAPHPGSHVGQDDGRSDADPEGVVAHVAGLHPAQLPAGLGGQPGHAVDGAVDEAEVDAEAEGAGESASAGRTRWRPRPRRCTSRGRARPAPARGWTGAGRHSRRPAIRPMNDTPTAIAPITHLVPVATWTAGAMVAGKTGASHLSRKSRPPKGALISQPIDDANPRMISGMVMTQGASWGWPPARTAPSTGIGRPVRSARAQPGRGPRGPGGPVGAVVLDPAGLAGEDQHHLAAHVVGGEPGGDHPDGPQGRALVPGGLQDVVLGPEAVEGRDGGQGQVAGEEGPAGDRAGTCQSPPIRFMFCSSCRAWMTAPAERNSRP